MTNEEFFSKYADEAMVGLVGGTHFLDKSIRKAQKKIVANRSASAMSHAFIIGEKRRDGKRWIIESDFDLRGPQLLVGVQENRIDKYFDEKAYPNLAILDLGLSKDVKEQILKESLELVALRAPYSLREIFGIMVSFAGDSKRKRENRFSKDGSFVCSTFVQHLYAKAGIWFNTEVSGRHITPEDIYKTAVACKRRELIRIQ